MNADVNAIEQDGELWLNARQLIAALRAKSEWWDSQATEEPEGGYPRDAYRTSCWSAAFVLDNAATALDLECLARVNEERTS